jgi:hypothetical protein
MENRNHTRLVSSMPVILYVEGNGRIKGILKDVSQGGVAVSLVDQDNLPFQQGDTIFMLADNMDEAFCMEIIRITDSIIGLQFVGD